MTVSSAVDFAHRQVWLSFPASKRILTAIRDTPNVVEEAGLISELLQRLEAGILSFR